MKVIKKEGDLVRIKSYPLGRLAYILKKETMRGCSKCKVSQAEKRRVKEEAKKRLKESGHYIALQLFADDEEITVVV